MRGARQFNKRIQVWETTETADGFGGALTNEVQLTATWANIETYVYGSKQYNAPNFGINDPQGAIKVIVRQRKDFVWSNLNQFIVYSGIKYFLNTQPVNEGFRHAYVSFIATREATKGIIPTPPIGGTQFPYTFNFILQT